jgi:hypothetical protein
VAQWLNMLAHQAESALAAIGPAGDRETKRLVEDVTLLSSMAHFFAFKLRTGLYFALWQKSASHDAGARAIYAYQVGRDLWAGLAERAKSVYAADVSYGEIAQRRGHWSDRLAAIDADLAAMKAAIAAQPGTEEGLAAVNAVSMLPPRLETAARHIPPGQFRPGADLPIALNGAGDVSALLFYRHVNHGERWRSMAMSQEGDGFRAAIPAAYTNSPYPLQYYFALQKGVQAVLHPGFNATLSNQPYFAVWKRG